MTAMGMILGTAAYMSPGAGEGTPGRQAQRRLGVRRVLYEMLTGQRAFEGDDVSDTLAAVLRQDVDWTALPASTPAPVRRLIARCLDRDVKRRLRDIGEARIVLDDPATLTSANVRDADAQHPPQPLWRRAIPVVLSAIVAGALAGTAAWYLKPVRPACGHSIPITCCQRASPSRVWPAAWSTSRRTARRWCMSQMAGSICESCRNRTRLRFRAPKAIKP